MSARRCEASLETGEQCVLTFDHSCEVEHIFEDTTPLRPDVAPPKSDTTKYFEAIAPPKEDARRCDHLGSWFVDSCAECKAELKRRSENVRETLAPPSDAAPETLLDSLARKAVWRIKEELRHHETDCKCPTCVAVGILYGYHCVARSGHPEDAPGGPAEEKDPHWPYIHSVAGDMHRNCGGQLRYRVLNDDHDDRKYQCDECGKQWVEEGSDA